MRPDLTTATTTVRQGDPGGELDLAGLGALRAVGVRFASAGARSVRVEGLTDAGVWRVVAERALGPVVTGWSAPAAGVVRRLRVVGDDPAGPDHAALRAWCLTDPDLAVVDDAVVTASSHHPWHPPEAVLDLPVTRSWWAAVDDPAPVLTLRRSGGGPISVLRLLAAAPATDPAVPPSDPGPDPRPDPTVRPLLPTVEVAPTPDGPWRPTDDPTPDGPGWLAHRLPADTVAVRLTGARGLAAVELLATPGAPPDDAVPVLPWWSTGSPVMRYFPKHYGVDFAQVTAELPELRRRGFTVIELAGIKQGPPSAFAGLGATDDYAVDHRLGDLAGLRALIAAAHAHGIRVIAFDNLGYAHRSAPAFTAAAARVAADPDADPYPFLIRTEAPDPTAPRADRWFRDPDSGAWYFAYWGEDLPSYDWHREAWREESSRILRFWLDQGLDGLGIDAPAAYPGSDAAAERRHIGDVLADAGAWGFPEGIPAAPEGQRQTEWQRMVVEQRFTAVLDLSLTVWHYPRENRLLPAVESEDPAVLEPLLAAGRDAVAAVGGTTIEAPAWEADLMPAAAAPGEGTDGDGTPTSGEHAAIGVGDGTHPVAVVPADRRLLEIACLSLCGSMFYLTNGLHTYRAEVQVIPTWTAAEQVRLDRLLAAVGAEPALGPDGIRRLLPTADPRHVAWLRTDGTGRLAALVVLGFAAGPSTARVDLAGTGISTLGAELTGAGSPARPDGDDVDEGTGTIAVDLGPRGFAAYEVM